jgi:hypothetical protein
MQFVHRYVHFHDLEATDCCEWFGCCTGPIFGIPSTSMVRQPLSLLIPELDGKAPEAALLADDTKKGALKGHSTKIKIGPPKKFAVKHADRHALHLLVQVRAFSNCHRPQSTVAAKLVSPSRHGIIYTAISSTYQAFRLVLQWFT